MFVLIIRKDAGNRPKELVVDFCKSLFFTKSGEDVHIGPLVKVAQDLHSDFQVVHIRLF